MTGAAGNEKMTTMTRIAWLLMFGLMAITTWGEVVAAPKSLKASGKITVEDGMLHDAFAFDETGTKFAYIKMTGKGEVQLIIGPPLGTTIVADIASFSAAPEKILGLGGYWLVVSIEGQRRGAIVDARGRLGRTTMLFDDCELSYSPKAFILVSESMPMGTRRFSISALRPDGSALFTEDVLVEAGNTIKGSEGATFLGFTNSHLSAMVQIPGGYNAKTDVRQPPQFALYDVRTGKPGPGKIPPKLVNYLDYVRKRSEKPDQPAVMVLATGQKGFELVGPGETVRPIQLTVPVEDYDVLSLDQRYVGNKIFFSLVADRPERTKGDLAESDRYKLGFFSLDPDRAKVTVIGEIPLTNKKSIPWSVGGNKIAVQQKSAEGNREIVIYTH